PSTQEEERSGLGLNEWLGGYAGSEAHEQDAGCTCPVTARKPVSATATRRGVESPKPPVRAKRAATRRCPADQSRGRHLATASEGDRTKAGRPGGKSGETISCSRNSRQIHLAVTR